MDQHAQFRSAVRTVLTILQDETSDPADRVKRATDILLGLPVPMPQGEVRSGLLTDEEVAMMLREQREG